jgi:dipeptidyl aminopeptidase/acylaminoacyl peptidase
VWERAGVQNLWVGDATETAAVRAMTQFSSGDIGSPFWTADGTAMVFSHEGTLMRASVDGSAFTKHDASGSGAAGQFVPSPDRTRIAFTRAGDLWVRSLTDGQETRLTTTPATETGPVWSADGSRIAFSSATVVRREYAPDYSGAKILYTVTERTPHDLQVVPATGGAAVTIAADPAVERAPRWLDASHLVFERVSQSTTTREIIVADTTTGQGRVVVREVDEKWWSIPPSAQPGPQPSPDGQWIAFLSDRDDWDRVYVVSSRDNGGEPVAVSPAGREAWRPSWSPDGTRIVFDANSQEAPGTRTLFVVSVSNGRATGAPTPLTAGAGTNIAANWSPDGRAVVYQHTDTTNSADLYVASADGHGGSNGSANAPRRLSDSLPAGLDRTAFVTPTLVHYTASDGQKVPAYLFVPPRLDRAKKHPAIVWIHGDGVNQNYDGWHVERNYAVYYSFHQYLVQRGYIVLAPDYRGSIGYGRAWRQGVFADVGGKDYEDAALGARYLKSQAYIDGERIGVWGLSYGGFFTLQALTLAPREFRCGVNVAGVADYAMYYEDPWKGAWTYGRLRAPEDNPKAYAVASPLSRMDRLERPLLILHGTSDVNVPYLHSVRLADTLLKLGKDYDFVTYPGEFHYFTREHVLRDAWHRVERFFDRYLQTVTPGAASGRS